MNKVSIILPCYNPPTSWEDIIVQSIQSLESTFRSPIELIIVNDGSLVNIDAGIESIQAQLPVRYIQLPSNKGKGYALRQGVAAASGTYIIYTDIDFPYDLPSVQKVYEALQAGNDVVAGVKDESYYEHTPLVRKWISKLLRYAIKLFLNIRITDTQCGLKGFNQKGKNLFLQTTIDRYLFDLEFIYISSKKKHDCKLTSITAILRPGIHFRKMNYKILWQESRNFLKILFK